MAKIGLVSTYSIIEEGQHTFQIVGVNYKEDFGKLELVLKNEKGQSHTEFYSLLKQDGTPNEGAHIAFSITAKTALNDFTLEEIEHTDLMGKYFSCIVEHEPYTDREGKLKKAIKLKEKTPSTGWATTKDDLLSALE